MYYLNLHQEDEKGVEETAESSPTSHTEPDETSEDEATEPAPQPQPQPQQTPSYASMLQNSNQSFMQANAQQNMQAVNPSDVEGLVKVDPNAAFSTQNLQRELQVSNSAVELTFKLNQVWVELLTSKFSNFFYLSHLYLFRKL